MKPIIAFVVMTSLVFGESPREPRILFFMSESCIPCKAAIRDASPWLQASGWDVGNCDRDHIQLVDIDQRTDLAELYGIQQTPCMVLVDGPTKRKPVPYTGRGSLLAMFDKPKSAASSALVHSDQHSHKCSRCGTEWWHGDDQFGKAASHSCPKCGTMQWIVNQKAAAKPVALPVFKSQSNCPGGVCPTPKRGLFGWRNQ